MASFTRVLPSLVPFIFALLAFIFSLLAITSHDWAIRNQYPNDTDSISQITPIYTLYRSPFQICTEAITADISTNITALNTTDSSEDDQPPPPINYTYTSSCYRYKAYGMGRTSCELASVTNSNYVPQVGDRRQCQQIHYAGNYNIASTVFIGTTFILVIIMVIVNFFSLDNTNDSVTTAESEHAVTVGESEHHEHHHHQPSSTASTITLSLTHLILPFTIIGAATALISQYYAILGLIQSAPNNADFATSTGNREHHDPWVQGKALSVYMSLSWFWALLVAWAGWLVWGGGIGSVSGVRGYGRKRRGLRYD